MRILQAILRTAQHAWQAWREDVWSILRLTVAPGGIAVLGAMALVFLEQSLESTRALAEEAASGRPTGLILLLIATGLASFVAWYWSRAILRVLAPPNAQMNRLCRRVRVSVPLVWGSVPLIGLAFALSRTRQLWSAADDDVSRILSWAMLATVLLAGLLGVGVEAFRRRAAPEQDVETRRVRIPELPVMTLVILALSELLWFVLWIWTWTTQGQGVSRLNPPSLLMLAIVIWIPVVSFLTWLGARFRVPVLRTTLLAALLFTALNWNDNHIVRHHAAALPKERMVGPTFTSWLNARSDLKDYEEYPVFLVATEGGGLRAAYFTAMVLTALQDQCPSFAQHVFAISGVSGGSVGATIFDALAARTARNERREPCLAPLTGAGPMRRTADSILSHDLLTPLVGMALFPDVLQRILFWPVPSFDRALGLEVALERAWSKVVGDTALQLPFHSLWTDFERSAVPALMLNSTRVSTGERVLISPLSPQDERFNGLRTLEDYVGPRGLSLVTAAFVSARFPLVTPEAEFPSKEDAGEVGERLVDGGYFENSGAATLLELLSALRMSEAHPDTTRPKFMPVVIRIGYGERAATAGGEPATKFTASALSEVLTPVRALLNVRGARGVSAVRQLSTAITTLQDRGILAEMIEVDLMRDSVPLVLGWQMSGRARRDMSAQLERAGTCDLNNVQQDCPLGMVRRLLETRR